ncbi:23S rRNA (guanosine(2251)-2'-O)-methyltransferase RlmB [Desulfococcaceae bacterium HSG8]|nr:23S rRNA (guanosine(2251)-2'-O)-methyltransferase RlmB [Desulfococcaceae bacterium HSG8]
MKTEILFGIHPVLEAIRAGRRNFYECYISDDKLSGRLKSVVALAESYNIPVKRNKVSQLRSITATDYHQGIGAKVSEYPLADLSDIIDKTAEYFLLLLDNVADPRNLGALIRTGLCAGVNGVIIPKDRSAPPTPAVSKASAGAMEHILLARVTNLVSIIKELKKKGVWIAGMDSTANQSVFNADLTCSLAIVIGGEEKGIRPLVRKHCDFLISVPQEGPVSSLNASVAGAVAMYEAYRQKRL